VRRVRRGQLHLRRLRRRAKQRQVPGRLRPLRLLARLGGPRVRAAGGMPRLRWHARRNKGERASLRLLRLCACLTPRNALQDTRGACGGCREPTDPLYGTAGVPNYAVGGCVGCDGAHTQPHASGWR
jgi:hypothetical protein